MRNKHMISAALLLLASASVAGAQQKAAAPAKAPKLEQTWELGFRATTTTGDEARYERYQDLSSGLASKIWMGKETDAVAYDFNALNVGYNDQQYYLNYVKFGKLKLSASFTGQPLNYAYNTLTPYKDAGNNYFRLDSATRIRVQNKEPGVIGIGNSAATDVATIYRGLATTTPMSQQRDVMGLSMAYRMNEMASFDLAFSTIKKSGNQPWGAAFAFSDAQELPMNLDNRSNEITAGVEFNKPTLGMIRAEYQGSFFKNNFQTLEWDNPLRATDYDNGRVCCTVVNGVVLGPWDNSGYSNGNVARFGRMAMAPSNQFNTARVFGLYKMPGHTTLNAQLAFTKMTQDEEIIPWTTNTTIAKPATYVYYPGLESLPRQTANATVNGINAVINFATRPTDYFAFDMKYRFNDHDNITQHFDASNNVRFDGVPEAVPGTVSEGHDIRQNTMEAGATFTLPRTATALKFGYIMDDVKRSGRAFSDMTDYTFRTSLDAYQNQHFSLRGILEKTTRIGSGFSQETIEEGGGQHDLRFYDEADMDRLKTSVILTLTPHSKFDINLTLASIDDEYTGEGHEFGLLAAKNTSANASANYYATDKVTFGGMFGQEKFSSHQVSRNANPYATPKNPVYEPFDDPYRDWYLDNDETVMTVGLWIDVIKALPNTDFRLAYNFNDTDNELNLNGPRTEAMNAPDDPSKKNPLDPSRPCSAGITDCFYGQPNVTNTWSQLKFDVKHMFRPTMGLGLSYQYEKFEIVDFATTDVTPGVPRMDPLGAITTGYGNRPYTGSTFIAKFIYMF